MGAAIAPLALGAMVAGPAMGAFGQMAAGNAAANAANYNAMLAEQQGKEAAEQASVKAQLQGQQTEEVLGQQRASYGAAGVDPNKGTAVSVFRDTASKGALSQKLTKYQGQVQQLSDVEQGNLDVAQGQAQRQAGQLSAISTLLTGAGNAGVAGFNMYPPGG